MRISHIWLGLGEQRGPEQPPTVGAAAFIYAERCVCVCEYLHSGGMFTLHVHPGALWEGWLINILSGEAGRGGISPRGLFVLEIPPRAF